MRAPFSLTVAITALSLIFLFSVTTRAQDFSLSASDLRIEVGKSASIEISKPSAPVAVADVTFQAPAGLTVSAAAAGDKVKLTVGLEKPSNFTLPITVGGILKNLTVHPILTADKLPFHDSLDFTEQNPLLLKRGDPSSVFFKQIDLVLTPSDLKVGSTNEAAVKVSFDGQQLIITPVDRGDANITIKNSQDSLLKTLVVKVKESPKNIHPNVAEIAIDKDEPAVDWFEKIKLLGLGGVDVTNEQKANLTLSGGTVGTSRVFAIEGVTKINGLMKGDAPLTLTIGDTPLPAVMVHVTIKPTDVTFSSTLGSILRPNQSTTLTATLKNGTDIATDAVITKWALKGDANQFLSLTEFGPSNPNSVLVTVLPEAQPGIATITATFGDGVTKEFPFTIVVTNVTDFKFLQIKFDLLDEQTARDLFGKKAADDFHIAKIRLFNKLRDPSNLGNSILVYGESLEVNVALESKEDGQWKKITEADYPTYFGPADPDPPGTNQPKPPTVQGQTGSGSASPPTNNDVRCYRIHQKDFIARYRPMTFEMIANTHDRRDDRSTRSRILLVMNSLSSLTSFVTAIAVPGPSSDLPLGLDKFRNLLIPSFEKLFPSMRETQRQNIISMTMRPLEEIPFGSDLTRIVFFPKRSIKGAIPGHEIRIGGISISDACAEVAIIKKNGQP